MSFDGWRPVRLGDISQFSRERISQEELDIKNYVSTENMLPNKGGKTIASSLPKSNAVKYEVDQVLVSNIRPYFKKIWQATLSGGASADVLVFRTSTDVDSKYFYYLLSQDHFFDYMVAGSKGTKMPRGDKQQIMMYPLVLPPLDEQKAIAATLSCLDDKSELNNRINKTLEEMAQAFFKSWFVDFEPFQDGEFEDSELGMIPKGWRVGMLCDIAKVSSGKRPPVKENDQSSEMNIPVVGASNIMAYTNKHLFDEKILVTGRVGTHGVLQRFSTPSWPSDNTLVVKSNYFEFVYQVLCNIDYNSLNRGSTQPLITQTDLKNTIIMMPPNTVLEDYEATASKIMDVWNENNRQNRNLKAIRDTLLPKLMSGEVRVPIEEV